ncbi:sigma-70 family RNA polymerase sigma factor [Streptomyces xanthochromogenes]|uniref:sigma-70 family RNA polymerase sigma factor n=1 Tax=Streptomyces xanthochromogenes TaxID=67384 RepID=UPI002F42D71F
MGVEERDESLSDGGGPESGGPGGGRPPRQVPSQGGPGKAVPSGSASVPGQGVGGSGSEHVGAPEAGLNELGVNELGTHELGLHELGGTVLPGPWGPMDGVGEPGTSVPSQREGGLREGMTLDLAEAGQSDADLIHAMRAGDDSAYEELFRRHSEAVRRYARSCCRDAHTADDLTAEVFARTLQAVRGGAGPEQAVRAYLMTTVRRVAASWTRTAKREQLVDDFAVFAQQSARSADVSDDDTVDLGADVRAMHEAEQTLAMQAFRSLPERWQAVLWHTTVEEESPSEIAPLFGLSANATAVLASRAREGLKQAYLQAHVSSALTSGGDCARYADRLGAYARGGLRMRAERGLSKHLDECAKCRVAVVELKDVNAGIPALLPVAVIGWFAAGFSLKAAGVVAGGAAGAAGAGAAAAATGGSSSGGAAGSAAAAEGLGAPVKAGIAAAVAVAVAAGIVFALTGNDSAPPKPDAKPPAVAPVTPPKSPPSPSPPAAPAPVPPAPAPSPAPKKPAARPTLPKPTPPQPTPPRPAPPKPTPPKPTPPPPPAPPAPAPAVFQVNRLDYGILGDGTKPEVRLGGSSWLWQRSGMSIGEHRYAHGVTVHGRSSVTIDLNRQCRTYDAYAGVDDLTMGLGAVRFSLYGDGARLWHSPLLRGGDPAVPVHADISGRRTIRLVVEPAGPFGGVALADWAQSQISCR